MSVGLKDPSFIRVEGYASAIPNISDRWLHNCFSISSWFRFFCLIFYTSNDVGDVDAEFPEKMKRKTKAVGFELFGKDKNVPVLIVEKTAGLNLLRTWYEFLGFQDEWPDWKPHISLSYAPMLPNIEHLSLPTFDLVYDVVHVEDIKDEV